MSQPPSDAAGTAYRRKVWPKLIALVVLVAVVWLQPKFQVWLDGRNPGGSDASSEAGQQDSAASTTSQHSADRNRVVIVDVDAPVVAEVDRSDVTLSIEPASRSTSGSGQPLDNTEGVQSKSDAARSKAAPALGQLREIRNNVFESTAGLLYVPGSADNHRLRHVMQHSKDDTTKPIHGVFQGNRDQILALIDEAYQKAKKGGRDVQSKKQNDRLVYTVNLGRKIGYVGGSEGKRANHPSCRYVLIVLEDGNVVITAYPTKSF